MSLEEAFGLAPDVTSSPSQKPTPAMSAPSPSAKPSSSNAIASSGGEDLEFLMAQVAELEEDHHMQEMNETATAEEGGRKGSTANVSGTGTAGTAAVTSSNTATPNTANPNATSVFVNSLDPRTSEQDLRALFSSCGAIKRITILRDRQTQQPKGRAYVEFESEESVPKALLKENQSLHGRPIKLDRKRENIPAMQRGGGPPDQGMGGFGGMPMRGAPRGRGGQQPYNAQMMMMSMMQMMAASQMQQQQPYGRGGRGGRGYRGGGGGY